MSDEARADLARSLLPLTRHVMGGADEALQAQVLDRALEAYWAKPEFAIGTYYSWYARTAGA